jgi:phytoene dehydrogenase-like protein
VARIEQLAKRGDGCGQRVCLFCLRRLDQLWAARPVLGHGDYRAPIKGLYMCGAGTHPGGGVTGALGHNAAHEILRDRSVLVRLFG